jgi:hypothetical protein
VVSTLRAVLSGGVTLRDLIPVSAVTGVVVTICYGCAGSRAELDGSACRRCGGTGIDPNP